jgi:hypothetical protein
MRKNHAKNEERKFFLHMLEKPTIVEVSALPKQAKRGEMLAFQKPRV